MAGCIRVLSELLLTERRLNPPLSGALHLCPSIPPVVSINGRAYTRIPTLFNIPQPLQEMPRHSREEGTVMPHEDMTDDTHDGGPSDQQGALQEEPTNKDENKPSLREPRR